MISRYFFEDFDNVDKNTSKVAEDIEVDFDSIMDMEFDDPTLDIEEACKGKDCDLDIKEAVEDDIDVEEVEEDSIEAEEDTESEVQTVADLVKELAGYNGELKLDFKPVTIDGKEYKLNMFTFEESDDTLSLEVAIEEVPAEDESIEEGFELTPESKECKNVAVGSDCLYEGKVTTAAEFDALAKKAGMKAKK